MTGKEEVDCYLFVIQSNGRLSYLQSSGKSWAIGSLEGHVIASRDRHSDVFLLSSLFF